MSGHTTLVAGGAGFLGSHLCDALVARGDHVVCVDDFSTGSVLNIAHLVGLERFQLLDHDIVERGLEDRVFEMLDGAHLTRVLNLASPGSPSEYLQRPIDALEAGSIGTRHLLDLADRHGARFFLASTSEVYGDPLQHPQVESYRGNVDPIGERSANDEAKRFAEALTVAYHRTYGVDVRIARIFNTYGPRMQVDDGRVVTNFVNQALRGDPITIYGDGTQTRSFCYVDDQVRGLLAVLEGPVAAPVNVGDPTEITMLELAELVLLLTGSSSAVVRRPSLDGDPNRRRPDISLARDVLGWEPSIALRDGLARTVAWFRDGAHMRCSAQVA
jgi:dTDP-glucose 4,6-dehydratase